MPIFSSALEPVTAASSQGEEHETDSFEGFPTRAAVAEDLVQARTHDEALGVGGEGFGVGGQGFGIGG